MPDKTCAVVGRFATTLGVHGEPELELVAFKEGDPMGTRGGGGPSLATLIVDVEESVRGLFPVFVPLALQSFSP